MRKIVWKLKLLSKGRERRRFLLKKKNNQPVVKFFNKDYLDSVNDDICNTFEPFSLKKDYKYIGNVASNKRFLAFSVDDFRKSDFSVVLPLFAKYNAKATFNRVNSTSKLTEEMKNDIKNIIYNGSELGDHTHFHLQYLFSDPMINGQNPSSIEGKQKPYPSNDQIRNDRGDGKNVFGMVLTEKAKAYFPTLKDTSITVEQLSDKQCQLLREKWSVMKSGENIIYLLDILSNRYLGTSGTSNGSWDDFKGCYTGGIFTGCKTSANHEIWEKILLVTQIFYKKEAGLNADIRNWSLPGTSYGNAVSPFRIEDSGKYYFDLECEKPYNYSSKFPSSIYVDDEGKKKVRSWNDVLREFGYTSTSDTLYPGNADGKEHIAMSAVPLFLNEDLSRKDAILYSSMITRSFHYNTIVNEYNKSFFKGGKSKAEEMYDIGGSFYNFVETIRMNTANGIIQCEHLDSVDTYSERVFLEEMLRFCKDNNIEVISNSEAYDIAFNHRVSNGNLIYNPTFRNIAKEYFTKSEYVPENPDGYRGKCHVEKTAMGNKLIVEGNTIYLHYGIPLGNMKFEVNAKGDGEIQIYEIKNNTKKDLSDCVLNKSIHVNSDTFTLYSIDFRVDDYAIESFEHLCDGYGNKVMGLKIVYREGIEVINPKLLSN